MNLELHHKRALVTGSSRGIGAAIAHRLAAEGAAVLVHGRGEAGARRMAEEIRAAGGRAEASAGDLSTDAGAAAVLERVGEALGGLDILIHNAGTFTPCPWPEADAESWAETYNVNVLSMVRLTRGALAGMRKAGWGRIIHIASISARLAPPIFPDYAAAKAATVNMTVSLMQETAGSGITVNTVSPGPTLTATWEEFALELARRQGEEGELETVKERLLAGLMANPCGRFGAPEDVAALCAFLASPLAGYVNGADIPVTGGLGARA